MPDNPVGLPTAWCSWGSSRGSTSDPRGIPTPTNSYPSIPHLLWRPADTNRTAMSRYRRHINVKFLQNLQTSHALQKWTVTNPQRFWVDLYEYVGIIPPLPPGTKVAYDETKKMREVPEFFVSCRINYAENVLVPNTAANPDSVCLVGVREGGIDDPEELTWTQLTELVRMTRSALVRQGIKEGDVVGALMSNSIWIIVLFLATTCIGAIFTSIAPDMGVGGCVSRLAQVEPVLLFSDVDYALRGKRVSLLDKVKEVFKALAEGSSKPKLVLVPTGHAPHTVQEVPGAPDLGTSLSQYLSKSVSSDSLTYTRVEMSHPLVILYSSGTTGPPKCMLSPHGSIIQYKKIGYLHNNLDCNSTVFQYSSTSWVLWNVMNGHLSVGAKVVCYDGGALYPNPGELLCINERFKVTYWGTSPRYLLELEQSNIKPSDFDLSSLQLVTTTGATLTGEQMKWFYAAFPRTIHLSSVAGGTEIASSWIATNPAGPVYANEMQMWALGMDVDVLDSETGESIRHTGQSGELVCHKPFPSMPSGFWGDPEMKKYRESYFERFNDEIDVWAHHDFTQFNPQTGGIQIHGRSDGVLNPSGIRFGSAEVYSVVEGPLFNSIIADSVCVGRRRREDKDEAVFLFVIMAKGQKFTPELVEQLRKEISSALSPRHVPKFIFEVDEM
jgi:acetoacetyl-CoA synthetase